MFPAPGLQGDESGKGPSQPLRPLGAAASRRLVPVSPRHPPGPSGAAGAGTGCGTRQRGTLKNHPDCIALGEAAGGAGSPEPPPRGLSRCAVPRCSALPGAGGTAWQGRETRCVAHAGRSDTRRETVAEKVVRTAQEVLPCLSFLAFGVRINHLCSAFGHNNLITSELARDSAALSTMESNLRAARFLRDFPAACLRKSDSWFPTF